MPEGSDDFYTRIRLVGADEKIEFKINFHKDCRISIQQIGGNNKSKVMDMMKRNIPLIPIIVHAAPAFERIYHPGKITDLNTTDLKEGWVNFYRIHDYAAMAYFYLAKPESNLPPLQNVAIRTYKL